jgi:hypothetical protein
MTSRFAMHSKSSGRADGRQEIVDFTFEMIAFVEQFPR